MRRAFFSVCASALLAAASALPARPYTHQHTSSSLPIRWNAASISIVLSSSLQNPPANIKAGSDVEGAARRALRRWADAAGINFQITVGPQQLAIDDNVNVITVSPDNSLFVGGGVRTGRARVEFDPTTGFISEADMAINPLQQFSTDGTHNTYDLESTFVHEIGHMLGLEHSGVVGASMQPRQVVNFLDLLQTSPRTLSDDDVAGIRTLYGRTPRQTGGSVTGTINYPAGAHVFAENVFTGRVHGSAISRADNTYRIDHLPVGAYRVVAEFLDEPVFVSEIISGTSRGPYAGINSGAPFPAQAAQTSVTAGQVSTVNFTVGGANLVNLRRHGLLLGGSAIIHAGPMPLLPGQSYRYYVAGEGVDQIPAANFSFTTPFIVLDPASHAVENSAAFGLPFPVVSFNIRVTDTARFGDYSLRAQSASGEVAYLAGALTIDPHTDRVEMNPIDAPDFFVRQQYRDFLLREADQSGFNAWMNVLNNCVNPFNTDQNNPSAACDRTQVSSSFFRSPEFELKGRYILRFYRVGLGRSPTYEEFVSDMQFLARPTAAEVLQRINEYPARFVARADFQPVAALPPDQYVNTLLDRYGLQQITTPDPADPNSTAKVVLTRADLIARLSAGALTRAQVLRAVVDSDEVANAEFNRGFVTMQYFGYLKRDPDPAGLQAWLNVLNRGDGFYVMVNGFLNSQEYRSRFGHP